MSARPRYERLASALRSDILAGRYRVGDLLPTERQLCEDHKVSRHTAREALRLLRQAGLVHRRRGAGTVVIATDKPNTLVQPVESLEALYQYARDAELAVESVSPRDPDDPFAIGLGLPLDIDWVRISGNRTVPGRPPIGRTRIFVRAAAMPNIEALKAHGRAITQHIDRAGGLAIDRIEQQVSAILLSERDAEALDAPVGSAALRMRRWFHDAEGAVGMATDTVHPADRFAYSTTLRDKIAAPGADAFKDRLK